MVDRTIAGNREQPGPQSAAARLEKLNPVPDAEERLLHQVFGKRGIAHNRNNDGPGETSIPVIEIRHCPLFPLSQATRQFFVVMAAELKRQKQASDGHSIAGY